MSERESTASSAERSGAGRYAPSPSGDLHIGNLRTALLAWLFARASSRRFYMRIEDLDRARDRGNADQQLADLTAIGVNWDGPPVRQTARATAYDRALDRLDAAGLVYECTCTRRDILAAPSAPHAPPGAYPGTCRNLSAAARRQAADRIAPRAPALRLRTPEAVSALEFDDEVLGRTTGEVDDLVLRRGDGTIAYNLAVVVDDADMGVDQVVRGADLASSTPRQILLQQLLGLPTPSYAHVPLVLGEGGDRLAKRDGAVTLADLKAQRVEAWQVLSAIAESLGLGSPGERVEPSLLIERFDPKRIPNEPWTWQAGEWPGGATS
ncbi:MAG: tRNA glutamyl-Q(34) synthetase GluQRS [Leucobacter sp.]